MLTYSRYKFTRFWAVYDGDELLCITVYLKGAMAVIERITGMVRPLTGLIALSEAMGPHVQTLPDGTHDILPGAA